MIIKTIRDAEFALNTLKREIDAIASQAVANTNGVSLAQVRDLIQKSQRNQIVTHQTFTNASQFDLTDIDATPSEGQILHRLIHLFYGDVRFARSIRLADGWFSTLDGLRQWKTNIGFDNPIGGADPNYQIRWLDSVTPALNYSFFLDPTLGLFLNGSVTPLTDNTGDVGNSTLRWKNAFFARDVNMNSTVASAFSGVLASTTPGDCNRLDFKRSRGTLSAPADVLINDRLGSIVNWGYRNGAYWPATYFDVYTNALPGASAVAAIMYWTSTDTTGTILNRWAFLPDGHIRPVLNNTYDLGTSTFRVRKLWAVDIDFSGTITGTLPTTEANTSLNANASASPTVTTTFTDLLSATVSLNKDGKWLIIANMTGTKDVNDSEVQGQLVYDGTAQLGILRIAAPSAASITTGTCRSWVVTVTSQPKTAKIQVCKLSGTGASTVDAVNSNIVAVYLTA